MGSFLVRVREPIENRRLSRNILDSGVLCGNRAAGARKRLENKEPGEISHFSAGSVRSAGAASSLCASLRPPHGAQRTRGLDPAPSPLLFASSHRKNVRKKWEPERGGKGRMCKDTIPCWCKAQREPTEDNARRPAFVRVLFGERPGSARSSQRRPSGIRR
jgi:hypothetical protein